MAAPYRACIRSAHAPSTTQRAPNASFTEERQQPILSVVLAVKPQKTPGENSANVAVHNYEATNWEVVNAIARVHLRDFTEFAKAVASKLEAG
jgi:hypothetical protein